MMGVPVDIASLSIEERIELIELLWESIESEHPDYQPSHDLTPAQAAELERRVATSGERNTAPWEDFLAELRQRAS